MNCEDVRRTINEENANLGAIAGHLKTCEKCRREFGSDYNLELALRELSSEAGTIDIAREIYDSIGSYKTSHSKYSFWRRWVWITALSISSILLLISIPTLIGWSKEFLSLISTLIPAANSGDLKAIESWYQQTGTGDYLKFALPVIALVFSILIAYLWREFKQIIG